MLSADPIPATGPTFRAITRGSAAPEWIPLREPGFYRLQGIDPVAGPRSMRSIPLRMRHLTMAGDATADDRPLLAGAMPLRCRCRLLRLPNVHRLGSAFVDATGCRRLRECADGRRRWCGLHRPGAAGICAVARGLEVRMVAPIVAGCRARSARSWGASTLHERNGVRFFHLGAGVTGYDGRACAGER